MSEKKTQPKVASDEVEYALLERPLPGRSKFLETELRGPGLRLRGSFLVMDDVHVYPLSSVAYLRMKRGG